MRFILIQISGYVILQTLVKHVVALDPIYVQYKQKPAKQQLEHKKDRCRLRVDNLLTNLTGREKSFNL